MLIRPLGDNALMVELGDVIDESTHERVQQAWRALVAAPLPGVLEVVPAYTTVTAFYDPVLAAQAGAPAEKIADWLGPQLLERISHPPKMEKFKGRTVEVPVCYDAEYGPDLGVVAKSAKLTAEEVIKLHCKPEYLVYLVGFAPGFPYLGGLPPALHVPRRSKPRMVVPPGSVAIGGAQTGIYPLATPGGWNLIGRTPLRLFQPLAQPPVLLRAGDRVKFRAIPKAEFAQLEAAG
jgi:inhibitor of KinA